MQSKSKVHNALHALAAAFRPLKQGAQERWDNLPLPCHGQIEFQCLMLVSSRHLQDSSPSCQQLAPHGALCTH